MQNLKDDPRFTQALEAHSDALGYLVSFALIRLRRTDWHTHAGDPIDIRFDQHYAEEEFYDPVHDFLRDILGEEFDPLRQITDEIEPQDLIRAAFELGFIDQAMKCQEALRRAQEK